MSLCISISNVLTITALPLSFSLLKSELKLRLRFKVLMIDNKEIDLPFK
jgi:hypothetical protein